MREFVVGCFVFAFWVAAPGCGSPGSGATDLDSTKTLSPPKPAVVARPELVRWKKAPLEASSGVVQPRQGAVIAATQWGLTTLGLFDGSGKMAPLAVKETGALSAAQRLSSLAYLVREGPNPAKNDIEVLDWRSGKTLIISPTGNDAVLGFTFDPAGEKLVYASMDLGNSRSTKVNWRVGMLDLQREESRVLVDSTVETFGQHEIPVPFEWSRRNGRIYFQGWSPFRGMIKQSVWEMDAIGGSVTKIVPAFRYVGTPQLSPDGGQLAYLYSDADALPSDYIAPPGAPPGNLVSVLDLSTRKELAWARGSKTAFGVFGWAEGGGEIIASEQHWSKGKFRDEAFRRFAKDNSRLIARIEQTDTPKRIVSLRECSGRKLLWVEKDGRSAKLYSGGDGGAQLLLELPNGNLQIIGCLD